jgi:purine-binding chemotaxis protein CheW
MSAMTEMMTQKSELPRMSGVFSTFFVDDLYFGVDVLGVQEVLRAQEMTPVPQAPDTIAGLINLRGQIVTAIDLRRRLDLPPRDSDQAQMNMVVRTADGGVSLLVDEIGDVLTLDPSACEWPPENLDRTARELIVAVYKLKDKLLLVLDTEKACEVCLDRISRKDKEGTPNLEAAPTRKKASLPASGVIAANSAESGSSRTPAKKASRKTAAQGSNGAGRAVAN